MTRDDFVEFTSVITGMASLKGRELAKPAIQAYWLAMEDWELPDFKAAAKRLMRTCKFMPEPYDFEQLRREAADMTSGEAWELARATARSMRGGLGFSDIGVTSGDARVDAAARAIGGYSQIAMCDTDWLHRRAEQFAERYEAAVDAGEVRAALPSLVSPAIAALRGPDGSVSTWRPALPAPERGAPERIGGSRPKPQMQQAEHSEATLKGLVWQLLIAGTEIPDVLRTMAQYGIAPETVRAWCTEAQKAAEVPA